MIDRGAIWKELQASAPSGDVISSAFFDWTEALAERVRSGEVTAMDALQAMKWLVVERLAALEAERAQRYQARVSELVGGAELGSREPPRSSDV